MELTYTDLEELAQTIIEKLKKEFEIKHMSGNLINTIEIHTTPDTIAIRIPARTYNMLLFQTKGVVVHYGNNSYASKLDDEGSSFMTYPTGTRKGAKRVSPGNHKGYVDKVINEAVDEWMARQGRFTSKTVTEL